MEKEVILKIENLSKFFKSRNNYKIALDNISFDVREGDFLGIIGESGSGKTTLGKTIIRLNSASSGKINLFGRNISNKKINKDTNKFLYKNIQMIFQDPLSSLNPKMNILKIISEPIIIDKSMKNQSLKIIKKKEKINSLFQYDILMELEENKYEYLKKYYDTYHEIILQTLEKVKVFKFTNDDSWVDSFIELESLYDFFINLEKKAIEIANEMFFNVQKILSKYEDKISNKDVDEKFKNYLNALEEVEIFENEFKTKINSINDFKSKLSKINFEMNSIKNSNLIDNQFNDLNIHIKSNTNNYKIAKTKKDYHYNYLLSLRDKLKMKILKDFSKFIYVEQDEILNEFSILENKIDSLFKEIFVNIFDNNLSENYESKMGNIQYDKIQNEIDNKISTTLMEANKKLEIFNEKNLLKFNKFKEEKKEILIKIREAKLNKLKLKNNLKNNPEYLKKINSFKNIKIEVNKFICKRKNDYLKFRKDKIAYLKVEINKKNKLVKQQKKILKNEYKELNKKLFQIRPKVLSKFTKKEAFTLIRNNKKSMGSQLKMKLSSMNLIDFELKKILEYYFIEEKICSSNRKKLLFYRNDIKKLLILNKIFDLLESVGLKKEHAYRYPHEFSGGQRQRIVIARALINKPKIIIADEAISALDVSVQAQVINMMQELSKNKNVTFLFIAHDLSMVRYICNKVLIMHNGKVLEKGLVNKIFKNPIHPYTKSLLKAIPELNKMHVDLSVFGDDSNYDKEYTISNMPHFIKVENDHEVLATEKQYNQWIQ